MTTNELIEKLKKYPDILVRTYPKSQYEPEIKLEIYPETKCECNNNQTILLTNTKNYIKVLEVRV